LFKKNQEISAMANSPASDADESLITPFTPGVPQADLDDLRERLAWTRWPILLPGDDRDLGVPVAYLCILSEYWRDSYDWRREEVRLDSGPRAVLFAAQPIEVVIQRGVVEILHAGVLVAVHAGRWALRCPAMNGRCRNSSPARAQRRSP
jgi:hypothetical protein